VKKYLLIVSLTVGLCLLTKSCVKEGDLDFSNLGVADNFMYDLPLPLVDTRLTLSDLLKNIQGQYVIADENGLLRLIYNESFRFDFSDLDVFISNLSFVERLPQIPVPPDSLFPIDSIEVLRSFSAKLITNDGIRIDSAKAQTMDFQLEIHTGIRNKARFEITSHNIVDASGRPFSISELLPGVSYGNQQISVKLDLSNYNIIPDNSDPNNQQALRFNCTVTIFKDTLVTERYQASTSLYFFLENIEIDYAYGYFGKQIFGPNEGGIDIPVFERFPIDILEIENVNMNLTVTNGFGIPVLLDAEISTLTRNPANPIKTLPLHNIRVDHPQNPLAPPLVTTFQEKIEDLINDNSGYFPYRMTYSSTITTNPDDDRTELNFVSKNSFLKVDIGAEIPMRLRIGGLIASDTINFGGLPFSDGIEYFTIKMNIHNAFPLEAAVYLYLLDEQQEIIDSVWTSRPNETEKRPLEIIAAEVDPVTGHVVRPSVAQMEINLTKSQIENLVVARYFKIRGILNTSDHEKMMSSIFENSDTEGFLRVMMGCRIKASKSILDLLDEL
jgi:hypothetical protein